MSYKKFTENDIFSNTMRAYPKVNFFISDGRVYYNNTPHQPGTRNVGGQVRNADVGHISLHEYNIDRPYVALGSTGETGGTTVPLLSQVDDTGAPMAPAKQDEGVPEFGRIAPWISKDSARSSFKTVGKVSYDTEFKYGDILLGSYPLSASITRDFITTAFTSSTAYPSTAATRRYSALRNRLNFYSSISLHYKVSSPYGNKDEQTLNMVSIPSIFYGTKIKPGSVSLKWNLTGSIIGELRDTKENGELIQVSGTIESNIGKVAGVVLYDEGILLLTGSWSLAPETIHLKDSSTAVSPSWIYFGVGANDGLDQSNLNADYVSASYNLDFKGHTETQVVTMYAHARRGETNFSNNPTFLKFNQNKLEFTSSQVYEQRDDIEIKNTVSSSHSDYNASFQRQVYISKVAVYDKFKNIIGVASLSNPVLKKEDQDISFKIKLDI